MWNDLWTQTWLERSETSSSSRFPYHIFSHEITIFPSYPVENSQCLWWFRWRKWRPGSSPDSSTLHKHISVAQLLELADPPLKLQDVAKTGAVDPDPAMGHGWSWWQFHLSVFFWLEKTWKKTWINISILMTWRILKHLCFPFSGQINAVSRIWAVDASCFDAVWSSNGGYRVNKTWQGTKSDHFCRCFAAMFGDQHGYSYGGIRRNPVC